MIFVFPVFLGVKCECMKKDTDRIKEKLDIVEFIKSYVDLKPAGKNFKGVCPFHQETDASFIVSPERRTWHCFGCSEGGDIIKFVMMYENFEFPEALQFLAEKAGIEIETRKGKDQRESEVLYDVNAEAANFFHRSLAENKKALLYLKNRGLNNESVKEFKLGYSPGGDKLVVYLLKKGYKLKDLINAGLVYKSKSNMYRDRFEGRIIFPIVNRLERMVGFSGRILEPSGDLAKYINTPQTPVYNKSKILYGLNKAKGEIMNSRTAFLVEGYMDVIMAWQAGISNAVAVSGTALTAEHLVSLQRLADTVIVSFDNDSGGLRALERAIDLFGRFDFLVKAADLGKYNDPADAAKDDPAFLKRAVGEAEPAMTRLFKASFSGDLGMVERKKTVRIMLKKIKGIQSSVDQDAWIKELAEYSGVSEVSLRTEFDKIEESPVYDEESEDVENLSPGERINLISHRLLVLAFTNGDFLRIVEDNKILFPKKYREIIEDPKGSEAGFIDMEATYEVGGADKESVEKEFKELLRHLKIENLKSRQIELREKMRSIADGKSEKESAMKEFQEVAKSLDALKRKNIFSKQ